MQSHPPTSTDPTPAGDPTVRHLILGTAGHIDHGKTSLVRALTGTDTDRLPEEKRRGMTIELGFAELVIGRFHFGIVDVPGHERFVRTMVAGATGMDLALIVVAGDDSVMPQTIEHVEVLRLVGIRHAVVALTKADLVDQTLLEMVADDVRDLLRRTLDIQAPIIPVSAVDGRGLDELKRHLAEVAHRLPERSSDGPFRMAIDRVFTVQGRGTVVTGSVIQGHVHSGQTLELWPRGDTCRVRDLQTHGSDSTALHLGQRAALNLSGVDRAAITRGHELAAPGYLSPSRRIDAALDVLASAKREIKPHSRLRICIGTRELHARAVPLHRRSIPPGQSAFVQLRAREPMVAVYGQRFIARTENGTRTIGGGIILRPQAARWLKNQADELQALNTLLTSPPAERLRQVLADCEFDTLDNLTLAARTAITPADLPDMVNAINADKRMVEIGGPDRRCLPEVFETLCAKTQRRLRKYHERNPDQPGCSADMITGWLERTTAPGLGKPLFARLRDDGRINVRGRFVCLPEFAPQISAQDERVYDQMVLAYKHARFQPPAVDEAAAALNADVKRLRKLIKLALAFGDLVEIDGTIFLAAEHEADLRRAVRELIQQSGAVTVANVRQRLESSRKYVVPFMEYLDRIGVTVRQGDLRILRETVSA